MKTIKKFFYALLLLCAPSMYAQEVLNPSIPNGGVVGVGQSFNMLLFLSYNNTTYKDYTLKFTLPTGVAWDVVSANPWVNNSDRIFVADEQLVKIKSVVKNGQDYTLNLEFTGSGSATNIVVRGLVNNTVPSCTVNTPYPIMLQLLADAKITGQPDLNVSKSVELITPPTQPSPGNVKLSMTPGLETPVPSTGTTYNFPFYVDIEVSGSNLIKNPTVISLKFPSQVTYLRAVQYSGTPFHTPLTELDAIVPNNNVLNFPVGSGNTIMNKLIRVYFRSTSSFSTTTSATKFELIANGAEYIDCGTNESVIINMNKDIFDPSSTGNLSYNSGVITLPNQSGITFLPSIEIANANPSYCKDYCTDGTNTLGNGGTLYLEANRVYASSQSGSNPQFRIECPPGIKALSLILTNPSVGDPTPSITYQRYNESNTSSIGLGVTFPTSTNTVRYIYITNYSSNFKDETDFMLTYETIGNTIPTGAKFIASYPSINKPYETTYLLNPEACGRRLFIDDQYLNTTGTAFTDAVRYTTLNKTTYVRLKLFPESYRYKGLYQIKDAVYTLDASQYMQFELLNNYIIMGEQATGNTLKLNKAGQDYTGSTQNFKNMKFRLDANRLFIDQLDLDNTNPATCGQVKDLYIWLPVKVKNGTPFSQVDYTSSVSLNNVQNPNFALYNGLAKWNIDAVEVYNVFVEQKLSCSGIDYAEVAAKPGDVITMKYIVHNALDYPIKNIDLVFPKLPAGTTAVPYTINGVSSNVKIYELLPATQTIGAIRSRRKSLSSTEVFGATIVTPGAASQQVITSSLYQLLGRRSLVVEVKFKVISGTEGSHLVPDLFVMNTYKPVNGTGTEDDSGDPVKVKIDKSATACIEEPPCAECVTSFSPMRGKKYLLSAWVKESYRVITSGTATVGAFPADYKNAGIKITFNNGAIDEWGVFTATGPIIDGWQRIEASFTVPDDADDIHIDLVNKSATNDAYFDDIRLHPFRSNMKSFVYDPSTQRLTAELDENNYATLYEYDDEGILVRVKKETERGIMTIKESRNNQSKIYK